MPNKQSPFLTTFMLKAIYVLLEWYSAIGGVIYFICSNTSVTWYGIITQQQKKTSSVETS